MKKPMKYITAGPGAGKTRSLVKLIKKLLHNGVNPFMVTPITFSKAGAAEITNRLDGDITGRTIHSMAFNLIQIARKSRGSASPNIISEDESLRIMEQAVMEAGHKYRDAKVIMERLSAIRERGGNTNQAHPDELNIMEHYFHIMRERNALDYTGILEAAKKELLDPDLQDFIKGQYLFLDEAQDTNPYTEWAVVEVIAQQSQSFTAFGDRNQEIYGFKGSNFELLQNLFPKGYEIETINLNHRSTHEIVSAANNMAYHKSEMFAANDRKGDPVLWMDAVNSDYEQDYVASQIARLANNGVELKEIAILTRLHSQMFAVQRGLQLRGIPFTILGTAKGFFQQEEAKALAGYIDMAIDPMSSLMLEETINFPPCGIGLRCIYSLRKDNKLHWDHLLKAMHHGDKFPQQTIRRILRLLDTREYLDEINQDRIPIQQKLSQIIDITGIRDHLLADGDFNGMKALLELVDTSKEFGSLKEFSLYLREQIATPLVAKGVQMSTLHASKGQEWDVVLVPGVQDGVLPLKGGEEREENNLMYVGMTRAREKLVMTSNRQEPMSPYLRPGVYQETGIWPN